MSVVNYSMFNITEPTFYVDSGIQFMQVPVGSVVFYPPSSFMIYQTLVGIAILAVGLYLGYRRGKIVGKWEGK